MASWATRWIAWLDEKHRPRVPCVCCHEGFAGLVPDSNMTMPDREARENFAAYQARKGRSTSSADSSLAD